MITYLQSINPITKAKKVPRKTRVVFNSLVNDPEILSVKETLFKLFPELKSFDITKYIGTNFLDLPLLKNTQILATLQNTPECTLHLGKVENLVNNILLFQYFNCCLNQKITDVEDPSIFAFLSGKQTILSRLNSFPNDQISAILIPLQTSKTQLITWINSNWSTIAKSNKILPKFALNQLPKNLLLGKEIADLRDHRVAFSKIAIRLSDKYPDDSRLNDEAHIKSIHKRYKAYLDNGKNSLISINSLKGNTKT